MTAFAMSLRAQCNAERFTERQILVSAAQIPSPECVSALQYWTEVFSVAGMKSRRSLAALLITLFASCAKLSPELKMDVDEFLRWLKAPTN